MKTIKMMVTIIVVAMLFPFMPAFASGSPIFKVCQDGSNGMGMNMFWVIGHADEDVLIGVTELNGSFYGYSLMVPQNHVFGGDDTRVAGLALGPDDYVTLDIGYDGGDYVVTVNGGADYTTDCSFGGTGEITSEVLIPGGSAECYTLQVHDSDGGWSDVTDQNGEIVLHADDDGNLHLIANTSTNQTLSPSDYSASPTDCPAQ